MRDFSHLSNTPLNNEEMKETFLQIRWKGKKKKKKPRRVCSFSKVSSNIMKTPSKVHDPLSIWFLVVVVVPYVFHMLQFEWYVVCITLSSWRMAPWGLGWTNIQSGSPEFTFKPIIFVTLARLFQALKGSLSPSVKWG